MCILAASLTLRFYTRASGTFSFFHDVSALGDGVQVVISTPPKYGSVVLSEQQFNSFTYASNDYHAEQAGSSNGLDVIGYRFQRADGKQSEEGERP